MFHIRFHTNRDEVYVVTPDKPCNDDACFVILNTAEKTSTVYPWHLITTPIDIRYIEENP